MRWPRKRLSKFSENSFGLRARLRLVKGETQMRFARKPEIKNIYFNQSSSAAQMFLMK
jgi:hypothetical protein